MGKGDRFKKDSSSQRGVQVTAGEVWIVLLGSEAVLCSTGDRVYRGVRSEEEE